MAQITFGDLYFQISTKCLKDKKNSHDWASYESQDFCYECYENTKKIIEGKFDEWEEKDEKFTDNFYPIWCDDAEQKVEIDSDGWYNDEYRIPFIVQDKNLEKRLGIHWGDEITSHFDNEEISRFTNELLTALGKNSEMNFDWSVSEHTGASEEFTVTVTPNLKGKTPIVDVGIEQFDDDGDSGDDDYW